MKNMKLVGLTLLMVAGIPVGTKGEPLRTDINPALLYYRASQLAPDLSQADRDYLFANEWRGQKLPERFGELIARYNNELSLVRQAACALQSSTQPMLVPSSPESRLPHGGNGIFAVAS